MYTISSHSVMSLLVFIWLLDEQRKKKRGGEGALSFSASVLGTFLEKRSFVVWT